jgi:hypothetical protein
MIDVGCGTGRFLDFVKQAVTLMHINDTRVNAALTRAAACSTRPVAPLGRSQAFF